MIGEFAALGAALCWTFSAVFYKRALAATSPISANTVRCIGTGLVLVMFLAVLGRIGVLIELPTQTLFLACASGIIGLGLGDTLYMLSLKTIGVSRAVSITCTYPLFNLVWAYLLVGETITMPVAAGALTIVLGVWLLTSEKTDKACDELTVKHRARGAAFALSTAIAWSISISMINLAVKNAESLEQAYAVNTVRLLAVAALLSVYSLINKRGLSFMRVGRRNIALLWSGGLIAIGLGWFFLTYSFLLIPESQAVPISSTTPLFSTLAGITLLHEKTTAKIVLGSLLVVAGIFMIFTA
ncbi:MAG: DMT family transporter [Candidatus Bathyarchaeota archaeon]|nr:DMT family transporter [Candidatus Bathyarchaeota archaeon]MDW8040085.1 DMT family transporter [Nitrososphaerota archaeon]